MGGLVLGCKVPDICRDMFFTKVCYVCIAICLVLDVYVVISGDC